MTSLTSEVVFERMRDTYSLYEAKAKLSAIVRHVRAGNTVIVTVHGEPAIEMKPIAPSDTHLESRLNALAERGVLVRRPNAEPDIGLVKRKPGALKRFLDDRE
ncbi:MAG: type II toxin-antitoxin system prevent-host-death family antitoxin [Gemmatimonadaceae bacterium]